MVTLAVVTALVLYTLSRYRGAILGFFFLDDFWVMRDAARVHVRSVWDLAQFFRPGHAGFQLYRPLSTVVYYHLLHRLFAYDSSGYHAFHLLAFTVNVLLVFAITRRLTQSTSAAFAVGLLYAAVPGQAVGAYWLAAFTVTGTAFAVLLIMWCWLSLESVWRVTACTLLQMVALLFSEHAVAAPILLAIMASSVYREPWRQAARALAPSGVIVGAYLVGKLWYFTRVQPVWGAYALTLDVRTWLQHLGQYAVACVNALTLLNLRESTCLWIGASLVVLFLFAAWRSYRGGEPWSYMAAGIAVFVVSLAPVFPLRTHYKDHYVSVAALGMGLLVLGLCQLVSRYWRWLALALALVVVLLDAQTQGRAWRQNQIWQLVVNGSQTTAQWVGAVQHAAAQSAGSVEVLVPHDPMANWIFAIGQAETFFPSMPARVTSFDRQRPPQPREGQVVVRGPSGFRRGQPLPGWDARWDWLRRLAGGS